ncbi:MAG TPA: tectonin domain-containing protein [Vicinamibacterales bacterium]|nr:tectonin domain-containing protein [Vicinamibacterales bacterium]
MGARLLIVVFVALASMPSLASAQQGKDANVYQWNGSRWMPFNGYGIRLSVGPDGQPWVVNSSHEIFRAMNGAFQKLPGEAKDIGVGGDGSAWIIGTDDQVYRWNQNNWQKMPGSGIAISVDPSGSPWVIGADQQIYRWVNSQFTLQQGKAIDIAAGSNVWIIGTDNTVYQLQGNDWKPMGGVGVRISAGAPGTAWIVNDFGQIFRFENGSFVRVPGNAEDIAVNAAGQAFMVGARAGGRGQQPRRQ